MNRLAVLALIVSSGTALAEGGPTISDVMRARSYAMGGAFRALGAGTEVVEGNPAALGVQKRYLIELGGAWDPRNPFGFGSVSVMDSATSPMAAGLTYHLISVGANEHQRTAHVNTAAFSIPFGNALHMGMSMRHVLMTGATSANALTGDAGLLMNLGGIVFSLSGHNLIDIYNPDFPRYFAASGGFVSPVFSFAADVKGNFNGPQPIFSLSAGGEFVLGNAVPLRAGYTHEGWRNARIISGGVGLNIENGALDFGYQHELGGAYSRLLAITLRMQVQ